MGADIHSYVERRVLEPRFGDHRMREGARQFAVDGDSAAWDRLHTITWVEVKLLEWRMCKWPCEHDYEDHHYNHDPDITPWYADRNYWLFGVLGGVRPRGGEPLDGHYRGLPDGASCDWSEDNQYLHSMTWYTCQEILDADIPRGGSRDVENFVNMNKDLVKKYDQPRIILAWDS